MNIIEQELAAVERQCAEAMLVVGAAWLTSPWPFRHRFFVGVQKASAAYRMLRAQPDPTGRDETLKTSLDNHRRMLEEIATMKRIDEDQDAAIAAQSFLDSHPAS
jgi:hypothetical protein